MKKTDIYREHPDPEHRRWGRKYPKFPGVAECVRLLRSRKARGVWIDIIHYELTKNANLCLNDLVGAFQTETNEWVKLIVLFAICDARLSEAIPFLTEVARESHPEFAAYATKGLRSIGTVDARTALWFATHAQ
jgi:hypothetical protein